MSVIKMKVSFCVVIFALLFSPDYKLQTNYTTLTGKPYLELVQCFYFKSYLHIRFYYFSNKLYKGERKKITVHT